MQYVEITLEEANKLCNKNATVLVAIKNLEDVDIDAMFTRKHKDEYVGLFEDAQTIAKEIDNFVKRLNVFTEKQDLYNILPKGKQKTILYFND